MRNQNNNQNFLASAAQTLYGAQRKHDDEEKSLRNSLLSQLGDKVEAKHILYSSNDELMKMRDEMNGRNSGNQINRLGNFAEDGAITGSAAPVANKDLKMTPIRDLKSRQEYLKQGMCKLTDEKVIPGVNACSSDLELKIDNRQMKPETYAKLRKLLRTEEGFRDTAYKPLESDKWTIGYGHTKDVKPGDKITKEQAEKLYAEDFKTHSDSLKHVKVKLTENQKAALSSLIYNVGGTQFYNSKLLKKLNAKDYKGAADEFDTFNTKNGKVVDGLTDRRKREKELFLTPDD